MSNYKFSLAKALLLTAGSFGSLGVLSHGLSAGEAGFSLNTLKGEYILLERGASGSSSGVAVLGRMTFDSLGGVSACSMIIQSAASNSAVTCTGSYTVAPDGSGTVSLIQNAGAPGLDGEESVAATSSYSFLAFGAGATGLDVRAVRSENNRSVAVEFTRLQSGTVPAGLKGAYIFSEEGTLASTTNLAGLGLITFDGKGNASGWESVHAAEKNMVTPFVGTYSFESDGTGILTLVHTMPGTVPDGDSALTATAKYRFLVKGDANGVTELRAIRTDNGMAITASFKPQSR